MKLRVCSSMLRAQLTVQVLADPPKRELFRNGSQGQRTSNNPGSIFPAQRLPDATFSLKDDFFIFYLVK